MDITSKKKAPAGAFFIGVAIRNQFDNRALESLTTNSGQNRILCD